MTKSELIERLLENKDTPFYKSNYNIEEVIEMLKTMEVKGDVDYIEDEENVLDTMEKCFDYIEENIGEKSLPFSILGADTRLWINEHISEYLRDEYIDSNTIQQMVDNIEIEDDCIDYDNAEFRIDYSNQIGIESGSLSIDSYALSQNLKEFANEFVDCAVDGIEDICENIDRIEKKRKEKAEAERLEKEQEEKAEAEEQKELSEKIVLAQETENSEN